MKKNLANRFNRYKPDRSLFYYPGVDLLGIPLHLADLCLL